MSYPALTNGALAALTLAAAFALPVVARRIALAKSAAVRQPVDSAEERGVRSEIRDAPRVFVTASITGLEPSAVASIERLSAAVVQTLTEGGADVIAPAEFLADSGSSFEDVTRRLVSESDALVALVTRPSTGVGVEIATAAATGLSVLALVGTGGIPAALVGLPATVASIAGAESVLPIVRKWLNDRLPEIQQRKARRVAVWEATAAQLPRLRSVIDEVPDIEFEAVDITRMRAQVLLSHPSVFAQMTLFEMSSLQRLLRKDDLFGLLLREAVATASPRTSQAPPKQMGYAMSSREWNALLVATMRHSWEDIEVVAMVEQFFETTSDPTIRRRVDVGTPEGWRDLHRLVFGVTERR
jgi:hypothetical protein